ncbi:E3 ubiquitin-protein ligase TRIM39-like [Candoia aspera]|uniref:E3 ubiquitin-protein ligase TRIM39-like n=1 Tax=Candoia aspera TaxID=51853 RepID=UPI002FD872FE
MEQSKRFSLESTDRLRTENERLKFEKVSGQSDNTYMVIVFSDYKLFITQIVARYCSEAMEIRYQLKSCVLKSVNLKKKWASRLVPFGFDTKKQTNKHLFFPEQLKAAKEFSDVRFYRVDVTLDSKTAHPRLEVSEDGKSVKDTGNISKISNSLDIPNHMGILARQGYSKGKYYWEVDVSQKKKWDLGVASESICRKGKIILSPPNGYWVIGLDGGKEYWARTDPWTLLKVTGKPTRIGIFLDMSADKSLSFYDVNTKKKLHTFSIHCSEKMYPFFSLGIISEKEYNQPVKIVKSLEEEGTL